jgi:MYXO-CTERM domain-containing protein
MSTKGYLLACVLSLGLLGAKLANAAVIVGPDPLAPWQGFMNVFELPSNGGGFVFNSGWGTADLTATFSGNVLTLGPNSVNDPSTFWYQGGGAPGHPGNKNMDANMYVQSESMSGDTVTFTGTVLSNTLISPYTSVAFIKDFAPDFSSNVTVTAPLTPGPFLISLATTPGAGRHVQYGFETIGPDVWSTDRGPVGEVQITSVPEPAGLTLLGVAGIALLRRRRGGRRAVAA